MDNDVDQEFVMPPEESIDRDIERSHRMNEAIEALMPMRRGYVFAGIFVVFLFYAWIAYTFMR